MNDTIKQKVDKFVFKKTSHSGTGEKLGRNIQPEIGKIEGIKTLIATKDISRSELVRLHMAVKLLEKSIGNKLNEFN